MIGSLFGLLFIGLIVIGVPILIIWAFVSEFSSISPKSSGGHCLTNEERIDRIESGDYVRIKTGSGSLCGKVTHVSGDNYFIVDEKTGEEILIYRSQIWDV